MFFCYSGGLARIESKWSLFHDEVPIWSGRCSDSEQNPQISSKCHKTQRDLHSIEIHYRSSCSKFCTTSCLKITKFRQFSSFSCSTDQYLINIWRGGEFFMWRQTIHCYSGLDWPLTGRSVIQAWLIFVTLLKWVVFARKKLENVE